MEKDLVNPDACLNVKHSMSAEGCMVGTVPVLHGKHNSICSSGVSGKRLGAADGMPCVSSKASASFSHQLVDGANLLVRLTVCFSLQKYLLQIHPGCVLLYSCFFISR